MGATIRVRDVRASRGTAWIAEGWRLFRGAPTVWMGLSAGWMIITLGMVLVPVVGGVAANLLQPVFFASFALAAHKQRSGEEIEVAELFSGFRLPLRPLINVGAILLMAEIAIFFLMSLLGLPGMGGANEAVTVGEYVQQLQGKEWILLVGLVLTALVKGALWFAPALLAFHALSTTHALRWSVFAALSNVGAMVAYGIVLTVAFLVAVIPWGLGLILVVPVMLASTYTGYSDVFREADASAGEA